MFTNMPGMRSPIASQVPIFSRLRAQNCAPVTAPHLKRLTSITHFQALRQLWAIRISSPKHRRDEADGCEQSWRNPNAKCRKCDANDDGPQSYFTQNHFEVRFTIFSKSSDVIPRLNNVVCNRTLYATARWRSSSLAPLANLALI